VMTVLLPYYYRTLSHCYALFSIVYHAFSPVHDLRALACHAPFAAVVNPLIPKRNPLCSARASDGTIIYSYYYYYSYSYSSM
jgi:hypothetical protein